MIDEIPYRAAGTYSGASYIERDADARLRKAIKDNQRYPYIVAPRQSGKSSLLVRTWSFLDPAENRRALVDLSTFAIEDYEAFWRSLLDEIARSAEITEPGIVADRPEDTLSAWLLRFPAQKLVIFIDEIDTLITAPFRDQFFSKVRSLFNKRATDRAFKRLQIILAGAAHPSRLIQDHMRSPFNVGVEIQLDELTEARIRDLVTHLEGAEAQVDASVAERLHAATGGSVYLCQLTLEHLWALATEKPRIGPDDVDEAISDLVSSAGREIHFRNIYELVANNARLLAAFARLRRGEPIDERSTQDLRLSGLSDGTTPFRNEVYRRVFGEGGTLDLVKLTTADSPGYAAKIAQASPAPAALHESARMPPSFPAAAPPTPMPGGASASFDPLAAAPSPAGPPSPSPSPPLPQNAPAYPDETTRLASETLVRAYARKQALEEAGLGSTGVVVEIANLRSQLREGGDFRPGDVLREGRYLILEKIGRGGFATVWRAHDSVLAREVAIKVLHASLADNPQRRSRFRRGAEVMALLDHPSIVGVLDPSGEEGGLPYFVMALVKGPNLQDAVIEGKISPARALGIIATVGEALSFAHGRGIVHRDVNPGNIFLDEDGNPKLSDFDLVLFEGAGSGTQTGALGTFAYAAPEMLDKPHEADQRVDVYSLAMTAIFCLRSAELPRTVYQDREPVIDALDCCDVVKRALKRATSWDREARYPSIATFCEALRGVSVLADDETEAEADDAPLTPTGSRIKPYAPAITPPGPDAAREGAQVSPVFVARPPRRLGAAIAAGATLAVGGFLATRMIGVDWSRPIGNDISTGSGRAPASSGSGGDVPVVTASVAPLATFVPPPGHEGCPTGMVPVTSGGARASYCIDVTEVTVARYRACTDAGSCPAPTTRFTAFCNPESDRALNEHPVNCVTLGEAVALCRSRGARLPKEDEWVRAAAGDEGRLFPWGNQLFPHPEQRLNACDSKCGDLFSRSGEARIPTLFEASDGWGGTAPVGSYPAGDSPSGAHDLAGNVAEWTIGPDGPVVHGGSWHDSTATAVTTRHGVEASPETRSAYIGFRCAADAIPRGSVDQGL